LLENGEDKDSSLSHSRHGLTNNVSSNDCLGNAFLLNLRRMFETTINDGSVELVFEQEIFESSTMNTGVGGDPIE
jgi:hypothetical protein